jgi:hypothetical protein
MDAGITFRSGLVLSWGLALLAAGAVGGGAGQRPAEADGPCAGDAERYVDCGNGTVTDTATRLIWLQQADCLTAATHDEARAVVAALADGQCELTDRSTQGDWRLPTSAEWSATIGPAATGDCSAMVTGGLPNLTAAERGRCFQRLEERFGDSSASVYPAIASAVYVARARADEPGVVWLVLAGAGASNFIGTFGQGFPLRVWPVRTSRR